jgi:uncharacterized membrane protein required for colicin V production
MDAYTLTDIVIGIMTLVFLSVGLYRGISGELASGVGIVGAFCVAFFLYSFAVTLARKTGASPAFEGVVAGAIDIGFGIISYGLIRVIVNKFISTCIPQPTNALLGMLLGLIKSLGIVVALIWFNIVGISERSFFEIKSPVLCRLAEAVTEYTDIGGENK